MSENLNSSRRRSGTVIAAGLLLGALALLVLYTSRRAFLSPIALMIVAAIGVAALLLQLRLRPEISTTLGNKTRTAVLCVNILGLIFAVSALVGDILNLNRLGTLISPFAAVVCFAFSGVILTAALRKFRQ